jgi:hypothetical protein
MHRYVNHAGTDVSVCDLASGSRYAAPDLYAARRNSRDHDFFEMGISLDDLMRNPSNSATNCLRVHDRDAGG